MTRRARQETTRHPARSAQKQAESGRPNALGTRLRRISPALVLVVALFAIFFTIFLVRAQDSERERLTERGRVLAAELERAREQTADIERQLNALDTDAFVEEYARRHLGMVRSNEILFVDGEEAAEAREVQPSGE
ncbi:MAG: septum formation initiator family protein [Bacillota bacterium]|nr:septum formation initiator family protein [Bacillota bacterium]